jgi:hypothetical protein
VNRRRDSVRIEPRPSAASAVQGLDARRHAASAVSMLPGRRDSSEFPRCLVPGGDGEHLRMHADAVTPADRPPQGGVQCGSRGASLVGAERSARTSRIFRIPRSIRGESERARWLSSLRKGPWRGTKPRKDRAPPGWQRSDGCHGLDGGGKPRSRRSGQADLKGSTLATEPIGRDERDRRERQGGNGHGDVVRLRSSGILRGV